MKTGNIFLNQTLRFFFFYLLVLVALAVIKIFLLSESHVSSHGASQAVVRYMADLVEKKDVKSQPLIKKKKGWAHHMCFFSKSNKRKRDGVDFVKT